MGFYNITGWSGGCRRPLTYNLRPGQFRISSRPSFWGSPRRTTVINNYRGGCYGNCDQNGWGMPKWLSWTMGFGMISQMLGGIMETFFPHKVDGAGGEGGNKTELTEAQQHDLTLYTNHPSIKDNYTILGPKSDGSYMLINKKDNNKTEECKNYKELEAKLKNIIDGGKPATEVTGGGTESATNSGKAQGYIEALLNGAENEHNVTGSFENGKYVLSYKLADGTTAKVEYDEYDKFKTAAKNCIETGDPAKSKLTTETVSVTKAGEEQEKEEIVDNVAGSRRNLTVRKGTVPNGWYKATADQTIGEELYKDFVTSRQKGERASRHIAHTIINKKGGSINDYNFEKFEKALIAANPSVFDKDGNFVEGFNKDSLNKLDIPSKAILDRDYKNTSKNNHSDQQTKTINNNFYNNFANQAYK